jgi:electron transfer flavoprotein beta subunit
MDIVVLVKVVPNIDRVRFDMEKGTVDRSSAESEINPFDLNALEAALQIKEKFGGKIIALSMGPQSAEGVYRDVFARGAERAILLSDRRFAGADTLATSCTLSEAIRKLEHFDLVLCGEKTTDGDTGQVGNEVAEFLDIPSLYYVSMLGIDNGNIYATVELDGEKLVYKVDTPALLSVTKDANVPRLPTLREKLEARKKSIEIWDAEKLGGNAERYGAKGSPTRVAKTVVPKEEGRKGRVYRDVKEGIDALLSVLEA